MSQDDLIKRAEAWIHDYAGERGHTIIHELLTRVKELEINNAAFHLEKQRPQAQSNDDLQEAAAYMLSELETQNDGNIPHNLALPYAALRKAWSKK